MPSNGHAIYRTEEEVIKALFATGGNPKETAKLLQLSDVGQLRKRIKDSPELREAQMEAREQSLDIAEGVIVNGLKKGSQKSKLETAKWYLSRKGKARGYGDTSVNVNLNMDLREKVSKIPLEKRLEMLEYIEGVATNSE